MSNTIDSGRVGGGMRGFIGIGLVASKNERFGIQKETVKGIRNGRSRKYLQNVRSE